MLRAPSMKEPSLDGSTAAVPNGTNRLGLPVGMGLAQVVAWGSSYYLPAVLAGPIASDTGWPLAWVVGGLSFGLILSGLLSPRVGRAIDRHGGRPVLTLGSAILATGLVLLACSESLPAYFAAWFVMGAGMAMTLYDAAFASLGRLYGSEAKGLIAGVTLLGGLASTVCWPLSVFLMESIGWRGTCVVYAALNLFVAIPLYVFLLPHIPRLVTEPDVLLQRPGELSVAPNESRRTLQVRLLALSFTLHSVLASIIAVHLLSILQNLGLALGTAVALGALVGPSQVIGRLAQLAVGWRFHAIWTALAAAFLVSSSFGVLLTGNLALIVVALAFYGAGNGIQAIVRGTLPLAIFGGKGYATLVGRLAFPRLVAQALAPTGAAIMMVGGRSVPVLTLLLLVGLANVALIFLLYRVSVAGSHGVPAAGGKAA
jgi:Major Facilitator Superfamily